MKKHILLSCLLAVLLPSLALALPQEGKESGPRKIDTNGDGIITKSEAEAAGKSRILKGFDEIDADNNGELTREELRAHKEKHMQERRGKAKEADSDGNGSISLAEAEAADMKRLVKKFDEIDANNDGEVTRDEMQSYRQAKGGKAKGPVEERSQD